VCYFLGIFVCSTFWFWVVERKFLKYVVHRIVHSLRNKIMYLVYIPK
jgi:hypothetical protein